MPRGPNGERRPAGAFERGIQVMRIATGEIEEDIPSKGRSGGLVGGRARARKLPPERRQGSGHPPGHGEEVHGGRETAHEALRGEEGMI